MRFRVAGLALLAVGVQVHEFLATAGLLLTVASVVPEHRAIAWRPWALLLAWLGWVVVVPSALGRFPDDVGVARTLDWLAIPLVAHAASGLTASAWRPVLLAGGLTLLASCGAAGLQHYGVWPDAAWMAALPWQPANFHRVYEPVPGAIDRFLGGGLHLHRLKFAHVTSLGVVAFSVVGTRAAGRDRWLAWGTAAAGLAAVWLFPYARMASFSLVAVLIALALFQARNRLRAGLLAAGALGLSAALVAGLPSLRTRFESALDPGGNGDRSQLLASGMRAVEAHPLLGVGAGRFRPGLYATPTTPQHILDNHGRAHNQVLTMAAETGIPGALLFVAVVVLLAFRARKRPLGALALAALAYFALLGLVHDPLGHAPFSMALVLLVGVGLGVGSPAAPRPG